MRKYKVTCSQLVFSEAIIEANSAEEAQELAWEGNQDWQEVHYGDWEIEDVQIVRKVA